MIIEIFHPGKEEQIYKRFEEIERQLPEGVHYIDSWIDEGITTCYQVMESDQEEKIREWVKLWADLADFKIVPVITSGEARKKVIAG